MGLESYELREILAQSPTTIVRRAVRKRDGAPVVIKSLSRELPTARELGQLAFEYRILRKLESHGIVRAYDLEKQGNDLILVLEDFGGVNLVRGQAPLLALETALDVGISVARTLGYLHGRDVIHKDLTPANLLFNRLSGEVKLIDFGIASELSHEQQGGDTANHFEGTPPYISPEQTGRMNRDLDYRSDYYSLGVTLFELLTGALPFSASDTMGWLHCHISKPAPNARDVNPRVPESVSAVVRKLLAKNPDDRYQSSHALVRDLESCREESKSGAAIAHFVPGRHDIPERFQVSQTLFGREREASKLLAAFEDASSGNGLLLLVAGYSGVGKSVLIHELQKSIVARHGVFVSGKFDQLERNMPYGALIQALRGFVKQILREPEVQLQVWKKRLRAAVGSSGSVLLEMIPELEHILGVQAPVPALHPRESQVRFQRVVASFLEAAAQPEHPLVIFVDDLQWADPSTPELFVHLLSDAKLRHVLLIGSYRDNEVRDGHLLASAIARIREMAPDRVREISVQPLSAASVNQIVAETLRCTPVTSAPLSELIFRKTAGNPFFVKELLSVLARAGAFQFLAAQGRWAWDQEKVEAAAVSDNVVDLMVERLRKLPESTLASLRLAACIGNQFDLRTLALVSGFPAGAVAATLRQAVEEHVLIPVGGGYRLVEEGREYDQTRLDTLAVRYRFQHDRVQQAAYSLLDPDERSQVHLRIGRLLSSSGDVLEGESKIFEVVNHLNIGRALMTSREERRELVRLNELAGAQAKRATAYAIAASYFETAAELQSPEEWALEARRHFDCRREAIECLFHAGNPDTARERCKALASDAPDTWCVVMALELEARILDSQARLVEAIGILRRALALLGLVLPEDPAEIDRMIGEGIGKMQAHLARVPIEDFPQLPEMHDPQKILINNLLFQLVIPAIQAQPPLFLLTELLMFDLALSHGTTPVSCKNFVDCGIIQGPILGDYERAYRLGKMSFEFLKREASKPLAGAVHFVFSTFVSHWRAHYRESIDGFAETERWCLELGDNAHGMYAHTLGTQRRFFAGYPLEACQSKLDAAVAYLKHARADNQLNGVLIIQRAMARLRGSDTDQALLHELPEGQFADQLQATRNSQWLFLYGHTLALVNVFLGDFSSAERGNLLAREHLMTGGNILFSLPDHYLIDTLLGAWRLTTGMVGGDERASLLAELDGNLAKLQNWANHCADNFSHKHKFAAAEVARARGEPLHVVLDLYMGAIRAAGGDFVHLRALAAERLGDYWIEKGHPKIARVFLEEAYFLYERWGATAKLRQMRQLHARLFDASAESESGPHSTYTTVNRRTGRLQGGSLDMESLIKATRTISSEVTRDKLFTKLMETIVENAGAQWGCLILPSEGSDELYVEAVLDTQLERHDGVERQRIEDYEDLCADVVRYVARTAETVVIDDAARDPRYRDDPYISRTAVKSLLCLPVLNQGRLVAVLYVENNATTQAFTSGRLRLLQIIAGQAAISISNARLYDNLEAKVLERTQELTEKNLEIAAMLDSMQQGVFTIDSELRVQAGYSAHLEAILGTSAIAGKNCIELLFGNSELAPEALSGTCAALQFSFGATLSEARINVDHLIKEVERRSADGEKQYLEIDWNSIAGEAGETIGKILVVIRDVTMLKRLHATAAKNARELDIVGQILDCGQAEFQRFGEATHVALRQVQAWLRPGPSISRDLIDQIFRNIHTVKGNARMLGLLSVAEVAHAAEEEYVALRADPARAPDREALDAGVEKICAALEECEEICQRKLGVDSRQHETRSAEALAAIGSTVRDALDHSMEPMLALSRIAAALRRAAAITLSDLVSESVRMLPSLARELGKASPVVHCDGVPLELNPTWSRVLHDVLVHALRNALDHGIEPPAERRAAGKQPQGRIVIRAGRAGERILIQLSDDGRGLPIAALRRRLDDHASSDEEIAAQIFCAGISTAGWASQVSGRGVGLDAVRALLRRHGGDATVAFTAACHAGHRPFELVLDLPADAAAEEPRPSFPPPRLAANG